jgi:hypothetical protein
MLIMDDARKTNHTILAWPFGPNATGSEVFFLASAEAF